MGRRSVAFGYLSRRTSRYSVQSAASGGWSGIRTHGGVAPTPVFKTGALNRSAIHPAGGGTFSHARRGCKRRGSGAVVPSWPRLVSEHSPRRFRAARPLGSFVQIIRAASTLLWRNMIELERAGADVSGADGGTAAAIRVYRGADHLPRSRQDLRVSACLPRRGLPCAEVIGAVTGRRVRLFDMSAPDLGVSVVRALLG